MTQRLKTDVEIAIEDSQASRDLDRLGKRFASSFGKAFGDVLGQMGLPGPGVASTAARGLFGGLAGGLSTANRHISTDRGTDGRPRDRDQGDDRRRDARDSLLYRTPVWAASLASGTANTISAGGAGAGVRVAGDSLTRGLDMLADGITKAASALGDAGDAIPGLAGFTKAVGGVVGALTSLTASGLNLRHSQIQRLAALERPQATVYNLGGGQIPYGAYNKLGFMSQEAAQLHAAFYRSSGGAGPMINPGSMILSGISPEIVARYQATGAPGGGALGGFEVSRRQASVALGLGHGQGLRGRMLDEYLGKQLALAQRAADGNGFVDMAGVNNFLAGAFVMGGQGQFQPHGHNELQGLRGVNAATSLMGAGQRNLSGLRGMFSGLMDVALMSSSFKNAGSLEEALLNAERLAQSPGGVLGSVQGLGGAGKLALIGSGLSVGQSQALAGLPPVEPWAQGVGYGGSGTRGLLYSPKLAADERQIMDLVANDPKTNDAILHELKAINLFLLTVASGENVAMVTRTLAKAVDYLRELVEKSGWSAP